MKPKALAVVSAHWQAADDDGAERVEVNFDKDAGFVWVDAPFIILFCCFSLFRRFLLLLISIAFMKCHMNGNIEVLGRRTP